MSKLNIKIVNGYRETQSNEFFFRNDPYKTAGIQDLLSWMENSTEYQVIPIPHWQIQNTTIGDHSSYSHGVRIEKI